MVIRLCAELSRPFPAPNIPARAKHARTMKLDGVIQRRSLLPAFLAACSGRLPAVALAPPPAAVQDRQGFLEPAAEERLERILAKLEADTGYKIRVLTQSKNTAPELGPLLQDWRIGLGGKLRDPNAVLMVADRGLKGKLEAGTTDRGNTTCC